jgi:hypothetical protein
LWLTESLLLLLLLPAVAIVSQLTDDFIDLLEWYGDPKKRRKSSAVEKSVYLRKQYQALHGSAPGSARAKSGQGGGKAHSNSALSSGYSP